MNDTSRRARAPASVCGAEVGPTLPLLASPLAVNVTLRTPAGIRSHDGRGVSQTASPSVRTAVTPEARPATATPITRSVRTPATAGSENVSLSTSTVPGGPLPNPDVYRLAPRGR